MVGPPGPEGQQDRQDQQALLDRMDPQVLPDQQVLPEAAASRIYRI